MKRILLLVSVLATVGCSALEPAAVRPKQSEATKFHDFEGISVARDNFGTKLTF